MKTVKNLLTVLHLLSAIFTVYECTDKFIQNRKVKNEKMKTEDNQA